MVHLVCEGRIQITHGVVRDGCEMNDCIETTKVLHLDVPHVDEPRRDLVLFLSQRASIEQTRVESGNLVTGVPDEGGEHASDVTVVPCDQDSHIRLQIVQGGLPSFHRFSSRFLSLRVSMHCQNS